MKHHRIYILGGRRLSDSTPRIDAPLRAKAEKIWLTCVIKVPPAIMSVALSFDGSIRRLYLAVPSLYVAAPLAYFDDCPSHSISVPECGSAYRRFFSASKPTVLNFMSREIMEIMLSSSALCIKSRRNARRHEMLFLLYRAYAAISSQRQMPLLCRQHQQRRRLRHSAPQQIQRRRAFLTALRRLLQREN